MAQREIQHVVEHAIDELPEAFRLVFITRVIEGMNVEETAEILGLKPETVKTRLHRARNMLRDNVEKKIGPVVMEAFPFAGKRCERLTEAVLTRLGVSDDLTIPGTSGAPAPSNSCEPTTRRPIAGATGVSNHVRSIERGDRRIEPAERQRAGAGRKAHRSADRAYRLHRRA